MPWRHRLGVVGGDSDGHGRVRCGACFRRHDGGGRAAAVLRVGVIGGNARGSASRRARVPCHRSFCVATVRPSRHGIRCSLIRRRRVWCAYGPHRSSRCAHVRCRRRMDAGRHGSSRGRGSGACAVGRTLCRSHAPPVVRGGHDGGGCAARHVRRRPAFFLVFETGQPEAGAPRFVSCAVAFVAAQGRELER